MTSERGPFAIEMKSITKVFPGVVANREVDFSLAPAEIHALLGENGAGKTTLMNILSGLLRPDSGEIFVYGDKAVIHSPKDAFRYGICMVHQRPLLVGRLTVTENILLGADEKGRWRANDKDDILRLEGLCEQYGFRINPRTETWRLSAGEHQRVEILKALYRGARILILDEPTSVLTPQESDLLFNLVRSMKERGISIIYISHKLQEITSLADKASVMRAGQMQCTVDVAKTSAHDLACLMVGREVIQNTHKVPGSSGETILEVNHLSVQDDLGMPVVKDVSFSVKRGEIFGIAGVSGSGQVELAESLAGLRKPSSGAIRIKGKVQVHFTPQGFLEQGVGYLPDNLQRDAIAETLPVADNLIIKQYKQNRTIRKGPLIQKAAIFRFASSVIEQFDIRGAGLNAPAGTLSGGNLRKLVLARELINEPDLLIASQPTSGLDIAATEFMHRQLLDQRNQQRAVLLISDNLDEVLLLSDVIGVMHNGIMTAVLPSEKADRNLVGMLMGGAEPEKI